MSIQPDISWLFETSALKIAPAYSPFWYTSGLIGAYYINTQYLCGGSEEATRILDLIDHHQDDHGAFHGFILTALERVYKTHAIYKKMIDAMIDAINTEFPVDEIDFISGGQRRDWFFSPLLASILGKPLLYIYNDGSVYYKDGEQVTDLSGKKVLNTADLLTVGSSYTKKWVPTIQGLGGELLYSINGVDRNQGGVANLEGAGIIKVYSLFSIDLSLFDQALEMNYIDQAQYDMVKGYLEDSYNYMRQFLIDHPQFLEAARNSDNEKTRKRAQTLISEDLYKLNQ